MTQELPPASTLSHYRIVSKLGAGGMGEVYLAHDTKLDRKVALKVLPADVSSNRDRMERFIREAKSSAALNHPNIAHVYEIGEAEVRDTTPPVKDGSGVEPTPEVVHYIAMEFIDGVTLREKIHQERTSLPKLLRYLVQVAEGLNKAHLAGIVHRDLKPDNIMITRDDYAKVLDFGLAKLIETPFGIGGPGRSGTEDPTMALSPHLPLTPSLSTPGIVMGTIGYMSPEQASGRVNEIDHRSDIFSFGCILFEAATGRKAFEGKDALDSLHKIVHAPTPILREVNPLAPDDLQRVVRRCLAKEVDKRYQSMKEVSIEIDDLWQELKSHTESNYNVPLKTGANPLATPSATTGDQGFWVAVIPFKYRGSNVDLETMAEGLSDEIVTGLSRFSYLRVIARGSTLNYANRTTDLRTVGKELGARYVMEGTLRQAGTKLRLSVQLVDAINGAHLWAENYERTFSPETVFELQDDLVPRIVSTIADQHGVLPRSMSEVVRLKPADQLSPYEAVLRSFAYTERITADELADALACLELVTQKAPSYADALAVLASLYTQDFGQGFGLRENPLFKGEIVARKAVELAPSNHLGWFGLAQVLFFQKEFQTFTQAAERSAALNSMDGNSIASLGEMMTFSGNWERGLALAERAKQLNPNHPGWYWYANFHHAYSQHDYQTALDFALRVNLPGHWASHATIAAAYGQLGQREAAAKALRDLVKLRPEASSTVRKDMGKWWTAQDVEHFIDGLRKAGLQIAGEEVVYLSGERRSEEGFWVAVLPFKSGGTNLDIKTLAEGLSEEIVTGLSRFPYLRVIDAASTQHSDRDNSDLRIVGKALGARYVLEGGLRQAGSTVRVAVKLVDTTSGAHLWAETYDRTFKPESVFELQDELVPRIVSTVADQYGALVHSMSESLRGKKVGEYSPHEAALRTFGYFERITEDEHREVREILEAAIADAPDHSNCLAMLASIYYHEYAQGYNPGPNPLERAYATAQRAVEAAPTNNLGHYVLALVLFFKKDFLAFRLTAERAIALNRMDASTTAFLGILLAYSGDWDGGLAIVRRAMELNPHHPGWYHFPVVYSHYRQRDYRGALESALKINMPGYVWFHVSLATIYGQLGDEERAEASLRDLAEVMPNFGEIARQQCSRWFDDELTGHVLDGLRKAGLKIGGAQTAAEVANSLSTSDGFDSRPALAVLPFDNHSNDPEQEYFADGLAEDLITRLSLWRSFPVIARNSSFVFKGRNLDLKKVSADLGVRYVVEGSVRKSGNKVRVAAQLIDAVTGQHVWAKTYDRELTDVFAVQDEISEGIAVSLVGDLQRAEQIRAQRRSPENLEAWELYQRALPLIYSFKREDVAHARHLLERAVAIDQFLATALARLAEVGVWEVMYEWTDESQRTLQLAISQARCAVDLDPLDAQAHIALSFALMTAGDGHGALEQARQAVELNPSMPFALALYAYHRHIAGHPPEESIASVQRSLRLSPHDPVEWLFYDVLAGAYLNAGRFEEGLEAGRRLIVLSPNYYWGYLWSAMNAVGLGKIQEARNLVREALRVKPELSFELARKCLGTMSPNVEARFLEALRQAGLEEAKSVEADRPTAQVNSAELRTLTLSGTSFDSLSSTVKTIAVLPLHNLSGDSEQEFFTDGITEEILNALAQIPGLRVAGRSSSFSFKGRNEDLRSVGQKLNVDSILEGTLRRSGDRLRITVQLIDTTTGYQLWSERYDRVIEDVFTVQDEIATTIAGRLQLSLSQQPREEQPPTKNIEAYELYLKGRALLYQRGLSIAKAIDCFSKAVAIDPSYAQAWAGLADGYTTSGYSGFQKAHDVMPRALAAARRSLELDENLAEAHNALACATLLYERNYDLARLEFKKALNLNPSYPQARAWYGLFYLQWVAGREEDARQELLRLLQIDPLSGYANVIFSFYCSSSGRSTEAVEHARRGVELDPNSYLAQWSLAVALEAVEQFVEAAMVAERALSMSGRHTWALATLGSIYGGWKKPAEANAIYAELKARREREYVQPAMVAVGAAAAENFDEAIAYAREALEVRDPLFVMIARSWWQYRSLSSLPEFLEIVGQLNLPNWDRS
jgi:TolB-like protein/Flp pilus assembly protein TadD